MDFILIDCNDGNPIIANDWTTADYLVFNAKDMEDFEKSWRVGHDTDDHADSYRILRCFADIRERYPNAKPGYHPYKDTEYRSGTGKRTAAVRREDGYYVELDLDGIKSYKMMEYPQMLWHVWVDFWLRQEPVAVWVAHKRKLAKYFAENLQLPAEKAIAQKYERKGSAAFTRAEYKAQQSLKTNGTNGVHENPATADLVFNDKATGEPINVGELKKCKIEVFPNRNWSRVVQWNPKDAFKIQEWLEFDRRWPIQVIA
jgi:hypothetical protein